jgi:hypothetical protein
MPSDREPKSILLSLSAWMHTMRECPDCTVLPKYESCHPSYQSYIHEADCGFLEDVNGLCDALGVRRIADSTGYTKDPESKKP